MFELISKTQRNLKNDLLSGLTVSLALIPEAVAFSFVAGVEPLVGLYAAFIVGLITAILGGRPGMISGATGALAVVIVALVANHGVEYLFATVILMGIIQITAGALGLGKLIRLVPYSVMLGFVNGLAIVIFLAQLSQFKFLDKMGQLQWLGGIDMITMLALVALTMSIIHYLPKITKTIPASLVAIVSVTGLVHLLGLDTKSVSDLASVSGGFPSLHIPTMVLNLENFKIILPYAAIMAAVGLIESLMTLQLVDEITATKGHANRECIGQGVANVVTGLFGGMGGCAMIGQSMINVNSGGRGRASGISAAVFLLLFIVVGSSLIELIPIAALVGVMFMVVLATFEWASIRALKRIPREDAFVIILVSGITVYADLAVAVFCGVVVSSLAFAWKKSEHIYSNEYLDEDGFKHYELNGPLFFASVQSFQKLFRPKDDPNKIFLDFKNSKVCDYSSIEAITNLTAKYKLLNKEVCIKYLGPDCLNLVKKSARSLVSK